MQTPSTQSRKLPRCALAAIETSSFKAPLWHIFSGNLADAQPLSVARRISAVEQQVLFALRVGLEALICVAEFVLGDHSNGIASLQTRIVWLLSSSHGELAMLFGK